MNMQHLRELSGIDLSGLATEMMNSQGRTWGGTVRQVGVGLNDQQVTFRLGGHEIPATSDGMEQLGTLVGIPRKFLPDADAEEQVYLLERRLGRESDNISVQYTETGISEVFRTDRVRLEPRAIVQRAMNVLGGDAPVVEWGVSPDELFFDVVVPENFDRGIGGDPRIGDISRGGLRFVQDRKNNHAPSVASYIYRLACTNGMVVPEIGRTIDARGGTVDSLLAELELAARAAFGKVEEQMEHYYALRSQPIEGDATQAVLQVARERGIPTRTAMALAERVPADLSDTGLGHPPTMFDLVNLFTNQANDPAMRHRRGPRRALEGAGGLLVQQHHDRCGNCQQVIG
jgi:hypothetical protein